jgi:DNA-binding YbaB/EbfC family protein
MAGGDMNEAMQQAQQLQEKLSEAQAELAETEVSGSAGGGMVTALVSGGGEVKSLQIDSQVVDPGDVEMLADMVVAAVNDALSSAKDVESEKLGGLTAGMGLPPGLV